MSFLTTDATPMNNNNSTGASGTTGYSDTHSRTAPSTQGQAVPQRVDISHSHGVHIGPIIHKNVESLQQDIMEHTPPQRSHVESLLRQQREITHEDMDVVCTHLGRSWRRVGLGMLYSMGQLDNIEDDYNRQYDRNYQLLTIWRDREANSASIANLTRILMKAKSYDSVNRLVP